MLIFNFMLLSHSNVIFYLHLSIFIYHCVYIKIRNFSGRKGLGEKVTLLHENFALRSRKMHFELNREIKMLRKIVFAGNQPQN